MGHLPPPTPRRVAYRAWGAEAQFLLPERMAAAVFAYLDGITLKQARGAGGAVPLLCYAVLDG